MPTFALTESVSEALNEPPSTKSFFGTVPVSASVSSGVTLYIIPHAADENDWHALHEATRAGSVPVVSLLLERGGEHLLGHKTRGGGTALWWARKLHGDDHAIVHFLEERGAPELGDEEL